MGGGPDGAETISPIGIFDLTLADSIPLSSQRPPFLSLSPLRPSCVCVERRNISSRVVLFGVAIARVDACGFFFSSAIVHRANFFYFLFQESKGK